MNSRARERRGAYPPVKDREGVVLHGLHEKVLAAIKTAAISPYHRGANSQHLADMMNGIEGPNPSQQQQRR